MPNRISPQRRECASLQSIKTHPRGLLELAVMFCWIVCLSLLVPSRAKSGQVTGHQHEEGSASLASVPLQPLAQQVRRPEDTLSFAGQPLPVKAHKAINQRSPQRMKALP
jgi:hypothetical protein